MGCSQVACLLVSRLPPVSYAPPVPVHAGEWWKVLNNGLDQAENERLAETVHIPEMVALILRGLGRLAQQPAPLDEQDAR